MEQFFYDIPRDGSVRKAHQHSIHAVLFDRDYCDRICHTTKHSDAPERVAVQFCSSAVELQSPRLADKAHHFRTLGGSSAVSGSPILRVILCGAESCAV